MPAVPNLDQQSTTRATGRQQQVTAPLGQDESGAQLQQLGNGLTALGQTGVAIMGDIQRRADAVRELDAANQLQRRMDELENDAEDGWRAQTGQRAFERPDGVSLATDYENRLIEAADEIAGSLGNDRQRRMFQRRVLNATSSQHSRVSRFENEEYTRYTTGVHTSAMALSAERMMSPDADFGEELAALTASAGELASITGVDQATSERATRETVSGAAIPAIATMIDNRDIEGAQALFDRLGTANLLTTEARDRITGVLQPAIDQQTVEDFVDGWEYGLEVNPGTPSSVSEDGEQPASATPMERGPMPRITHQYGQSPGGAFGAVRDGGRRQHAGEDRLYPANTPVQSEAHGRVVQIGRDHPQAGNWVGVQIGNDANGTPIFVRYLHLNRIDVEVGDMLERGQVFGLSGDTGTGGAHLHTEFRRGGTGGIDGAQVNPNEFRGGLPQYNGEGSARTHGSRPGPSVEQGIAAARRVFADRPDLREAAIAEIERRQGRRDRAEAREHRAARDAVLEYYRDNPSARYEDVPAAMRAALAPGDVAAMRSRGDMEENQARTREEAAISDLTRNQRYIRALETLRGDTSSDLTYDTLVSAYVEDPHRFANTDLSPYLRGDDGVPPLSTEQFTQLRELQTSYGEELAERNDPFAAVRRGRTALDPELDVADLNEAEMVDFNARYARRVLDARRSNGGAELTDLQLREIGIDLLGRSGRRTIFGIDTGIPTGTRNYQRPNYRRPSVRAIPAAARAQIRNDLRLQHPGRTITTEMVVDEYMRLVEGATR